MGEPRRIFLMALEVISFVGTGGLDDVTSPVCKAVAAQVATILFPCLN
jgi:hypothetical protein